MNKTIPIEQVVKDKNHLCLLPWININTNPDGKIKLCCSIQIDRFVSDDRPPFNLGYDSIELIWNSGYMKDVRQKHFSNEGAEDCKECYKIESLSGSSPRSGQNDEWIRRKVNDARTTKIVDKAAANGLESLGYLPISLELRLGNQCNLQCISCWGISSSLSHDERSGYLDKKLLDDPKMNWIKKDWENDRRIVESTDLKNWFETDMFYENFRKLAPNLKRLYTTGGEPTLIKANYQMFQMLLDAGNTECSVEFTSNMTTWNHEFYSRLEQFKNVEIQMSIDGTDQVGEYIRYPTNWSKVQENVERAVKLAQDKPGWKIKCYSVLQALNFRDIHTVWDLLNDVGQKYQKEIMWWPITLYMPYHLSLAAVPIQVRIDNIQRLKKLREVYARRDPYFQIDLSTWDAFYRSIMKSEYKEDLHKRLSNYVRFMDQQRSLDGELLFSDLLYD